ncbi:hypothetical protein MMC28_010294 [Mycoblastus sanguinarius]|nr:hypothetical protein [Mycoblastus sanguinarius]
MAKKRSDSENEPFPWHIGVFDAHCHPTDTVSSIDSIAGMRTRALTIMATRGQDQNIVADFADRLGVIEDTLPSLESAEQIETSRGHIIPSFGWHPWFSHQIYDDSSRDEGHSAALPNKFDHYNKVLSPSPKFDQFILSLPDPRPLSALLSQTQNYLERYQYALVGEIGLDRAFRIPGNELVDNGHDRDPSLTPGGREGRRLSPYRVSMDHQRKILRAQLNLAGKLQRAVSVHGVAAHGVVFETLEQTWRGHEKPLLSKRARKRAASVDAAHENEDDEVESHSPKAGSLKPFPPRICLHSYSGPVDTLRQYLHPSVPADIFFSFSGLVNFSSPTSTKSVDVIKAVPDNKILAESDLHAAGEKMDDLLEDIIRTICEIKGWQLDQGVKQLASNWMHYILGET